MTNSGIIGYGNWGNKLYKKLTHLSNVKFIGHVPDEDLPSYFSTSDILDRFLPLKRTSPKVGWSNNPIRCNKVDFPEPEGPIKETKSPPLIEILTFFITDISPTVPEYFFDKFDNLTISSFIF